MHNFFLKGLQKEVQKPIGESQRVIRITFTFELWLKRN